MKKTYLIRNRSNIAQDSNKNEYHIHSYVLNENTSFFQDFPLNEITLIPHSGKEAIQTFLKLLYIKWGEDSNNMIHKTNILEVTEMFHKFFCHRFETICIEKLMNMFQKNQEREDQFIYDAFQLLINIKSVILRKCILQYLEKQGKLVEFVMKMHS